MLAPFTFNHGRNANQDWFGAGLNNAAITRRGMMGGERFGFGNTSIPQIGLGGIENGVVGSGRLGGVKLPPVRANAFGFGAIGNNEFGLNEINALPLGGLALQASGGLGAQNRLNFNNLNGSGHPLRNGFLPLSLLHNRVRGNGLLGRNVENHYVYPPLEEHFMISVSIQSINNKRNGLLGRIWGYSTSNFVLTIPFTATLSDILEELNKGKWDYNSNNIFLVSNKGEYLSLDGLVEIGMTVDEFYMIASHLVIVQN